MQIEEFNVPMPWGHIAVKAWGNKNYNHVIMCHGRLDNAGAFDFLIPLLPEVYYYICVDFPGHGQSTYLPLHFPFNHTDFLFTLKLLADYFGKEKYILLGHSYGAVIQHYFAQIYPEYVEKFIAIDSIMAFLPLTQYRNHFYQVFKRISDIHDGKRVLSNKTYSEKEIVEKLCAGRWSEPIPLKAAKALARRMLKPLGDEKYQVLIDRRMIEPIFPLHDVDCIRKIVSECPVTCPLLLISCKNSPYLEFNKILIEEYQKRENFTVIWTNESHDVIMSKPETISSFISDFLLKVKPKL